MKTIKKTTMTAKQAKLQTKEIKENAKYKQINLYSNRGGGAKVCSFTGFKHCLQL